LSRILDRFKEFFDPDEQNRIDTEDLRDMQAFLSTRAYERFREWIKRQKSEVRWSPGMTQEQAASNLIAQSVYDELLEELDRMGRFVMEHLDGKE